MERILLKNIIEYSGGRPSPDVAALMSSSEPAVDGICTDSRKVRPGELFIPLVGEKFDGHDFIEEAFASGAAYALSSRGETAKSNLTRSMIYVGDTLDALQRIAGGYRAGMDVKVTAVTGSVGKTTTKEMIAAVLSERFEALKTEGNLNNTIGVPLSVLALESRHRAAVFEMGMSRFGEISAETKVARPDIAVITNIGTAHIEFLKSREGILKAKMEVADGMSPDGALILNGDDEMLWSQKGKTAFKTVYYGIENAEGDILATDIEEGDFDVSYTVRWTAKGDLSASEERITLPALGRHNILNSLAAFAVGLEYGLPSTSIARGLTAFENADMRQNIYIKDGFKIIDDCYNANPESMTAALGVLANMKTRGRKIAVLGDMLELGERSYDEHFALHRKAESAADAVFLYGENMKAYLEAGGGKARRFETREELAHALKSFARPGDVILFKGSRGMKIEEIRKLLLEEN